MKTNKKTHPAERMCGNAGQEMISARKAGTVPQRFFVFHGNHLLSLEGYLQSDYNTVLCVRQGKEWLELFFLLLVFSVPIPKNLLTNGGFIDIMK